MNLERPQIIEMDQERDRKTCIALDHKVTGANRELAQWLADHKIYSARVVADWLACGSTRIHYLRKWATDGFEGKPFPSGTSVHAHEQSPLKSQDNSEEELDAEEDVEKPDVAPPEEITSNFLETVSTHKAILRTYKKIFSVAALDRAQKDEVRAAIRDLITKWQHLERALSPKERL